MFKGSLVLKRVKRNVPKLLRFGLVGTLGAALNISVYIVMMKFTSLGMNISSICAFSVAVINNYIINHRWTFAAENENNPINRIQFTYYVLGNVIGLIVNLFVLNTLVAIAGIDFHLAGQFFGIACGMVFNFVFAKMIVFTVIGKQAGNVRE